MKKQQRRMSKTAKRPDGVTRELFGLGMVALGLWFFVAKVRSGGFLGALVIRLLSGLAGHGGAWLIALGLVFLGAYQIIRRFQKQELSLGKRFWTVIILFTAVEVVFQLTQIAADPLGGDVELAWQGAGGGLIGYGITRVLTVVFGLWGRYLVLATAVVVAILLNTSLTLGGTLVWVKDKIMMACRRMMVAVRARYHAQRAARAATSVSSAHPVRVQAQPDPAGTRASMNGAAPTSIRTVEAPHTSATQPGPIPQVQPAPPQSAPAPSNPSATPTGHTLPAQEATPALTLSSEAQAGPHGEYRLPALSLLAPAPQQGADDQAIHQQQADLLQRTLRSFGVEAQVVDVSPGPSVTRFELQPGAGVRVSKFTQLADDLALALAAEDIRIEAPVPGKAVVGIEIPNRVRQAVPLRSVMESQSFLGNPSKLAVAFGKDNAGNPVIGDLARMPHLLIAGSTGSGKSVCMNTIICSLLFKARPDEVKMLMIDPKMVELSTYNGIPHLMAPVITDVKKAAGYLKGAVREMEARYELFAAMGVRSIQQYNEKCLTESDTDPSRKPLPYIVIFIDELADLMMVAPADVEDAICRLAQMARACGMHLVIATQSPRVDVITGLIKANIPSRIAFAVSSQVDSRVIMDAAGAERLLGRGDMLYHPAGLSKSARAQGAFIDEPEIEALVRFVRAQGQPVYTAQEEEVEVGARRPAGNGVTETEPASAVDAIFPQAVRVVIENGQASVSILQRRLRCNYSKAARLIDMMEERGFIGTHQGSKPRNVLISLPQWQEMFGRATTAEETAAIN